MKRLLYLMGYPGAGKTTLMTLALADLPFTVRRDLFQRRYYPGGVMLGGDRLLERLGEASDKLFAGADALQRNAQPKVIQWLGQADTTCIVGEGERLTSRRFFEGALLAGWTVTVAYLDASQALCLLRQQQRGRLMHPQRWRYTVAKVQKLADWVDRQWILDATLPPEALAARLNEHPVMKAIRDGT